MPRKGDVPKRPTMPDPKFKSKLVSKFISCLMKDGKKSIAESAMYGAFEIVEQRTKEAPLNGCPKCGSSLSEQKEHEQFVVDIPPVEPEVTRYVTYSGHCTCCRRRVRFRSRRAGAGRRRPLRRCRGRCPRPGWRRSSRETIARRRAGRPVRYRSTRLG